MSTAIIHTPVTGARGLLWLAEAARDVGVDIVSLSWNGHASPAAHWRVQVTCRDDLDRLGDRLDLDPAVLDGWTAYRAGHWGDMDVEVFTGAVR